MAKHWRQCCSRASWVFTGFFKPLHLDVMLIDLNFFFLIRGTKQCLCLTQTFHWLQLDLDVHTNKIRVEKCQTAFVAAFPSKQTFQVRPQCYPNSQKRNKGHPPVIKVLQVTSAHAYTWDYICSSTQWNTLSLLTVRPLTIPECSQNNTIKHGTVLLLTWFFLPCLYLGF